MSKLTLDIIQNRLLEEDEVKKATFKRMKATNTPTREVGKPTDPSSKMTKITQIEVPSGNGKSASKSSGSKDESGIPQAKLAGEYIVDKVAPWSSAKNEKSPKLPSVKSGEKSNQETKMKEVKGAIKNTEAGVNSGVSTFPQSKFAQEYEGKMPRGNKNLGGGSDSVPTVGKPKVEKMTSTTAPKSSTRKANFDTRDSKKVSQITGPSDDMKMPSDAPKTPKVEKMAKTDNIRESVVVKLNGKIKASFDVVSNAVLNRLSESYSKYGYAITVERGPDAAWKHDLKFLGLLRESVDAKFNFVPGQQQRLRSAAMSRFRELCKDSYNNLYESRDEFGAVLVGAFKIIEKKMESKYIDGLNLYECTARVTLNNEAVDMEIVTEAGDHHMALRQVRNKLFENYGLDTKIKHIFIDGTKYTMKEIKEWAPKN